MRRLSPAPNLAIATLWADLLGQAGIAATVQRAFASSIAGELLARARTLLDELSRPVERHWNCPGCGEQVDGPFEQCWNCGAAMP